MRIVYNMRITFLFLFCFLLIAMPVTAGPYSDSAHGGAAGVKRIAPGFPSDYTTGNCAHCHEQHARINGDQPEPGELDGPPSPFALFAGNFDISKTVGPYDMEDDFCFYCHSRRAEALQSGGGIINYSYARTFGGYTHVNPNGILEAFNQGSYHNLYNVWEFARTKGWGFFGQGSNPCVACHNPHLVKANKSNPANPVYTAISRPVSHNELWGDGPGETMRDYAAAAIGGAYRPPYMYNSTASFEPAGSEMHDGSKIPDYNTFCLDCHSPEAGGGTIFSTTLGKNLRSINWTNTGDMHGRRLRLNGVDGSPQNWGTIKAPYDLNPVAFNYVLSCLDCHEPHGTILTNGYLLRKYINNNTVTGCGPGEANYCPESVCSSCHTKSHPCGYGPGGCFGCHYHNSRDHNCGGWFSGPTF